MIISKSAMDELSYTLLVIIVTIWLLFWKGIALWRAAKSDQLWWFVAIVVLSSATMSILEIVYLFFFAKKRLTMDEIMSWLPQSIVRKKK